MLAHGIGERGDLPLPLYLFIWGIALVIHGVVALRPREDDSARATSGSPGHGDA